MMRRIELSDGRQFACQDGRGVYCRVLGVFRAWEEPPLTPVFRSPKEFRDYLRTRFGIREVSVMDAWGWP